VSGDPSRAPLLCRSLAPADTPLRVAAARNHRRRCRRRITPRGHPLAAGTPRRPTSVMPTPRPSMAFRERRVSRPRVSGESRVCNPSFVADAAPNSTGPRRGARARVAVRIPWGGPPVPTAAPGRPHSCQRPPAASPPPPRRGCTAPALSSGLVPPGWAPPSQPGSPRPWPGEERTRSPRTPPFGGLHPPNQDRFSAPPVRRLHRAKKPY